MENERQETAIVPTTQTTAELIPGQTAELIEKSFAENTLRNRRQALKDFDGWLRGRPITDGVLAQYITDLFNDGKAPGTIAIAVSAVKWFLKHRNGGTPVELPITSATLSGIRREGRDRGRGQRNGLTWREVEKICAVQEADGTLRGIRNSAILRVMSDGLLRISEVTELRISDLEDNNIRVRFSKTDQEGQGEYLYLCEDTRQIVGEWLKRSELQEGYLFRRMTARGDNLYRDKDTGEPHKLTDDGVRVDNQAKCRESSVLLIRCQGIHFGLGRLWLWHKGERPLWTYRWRGDGKIRGCPHTMPAPSSLRGGQLRGSKMGNRDSPKNPLFETYEGDF